MKTRNRKGAGSIFGIKGCGNLYISYYDSNGKRVTESAKTADRAEAQKLLTRRLAARDTGKLPAQRQNQVRYGDLREKLLNSYREKGNKSLQTLADGTETVWGLKALDDFFGYPAKNPKATDITVTLMEKFNRQREAEGVSNATISCSLRYLRRMFSLATKAENATGQRLLEAVPNFSFRPKPLPREDYLTEAEFLKLLAALPANLQPLFQFLFYQGVRSGEAVSIRWGQIDLDGAVYTPNAMNNKTGDTRLKALADKTVEVLRSIQPDIVDPNERVLDATNLRGAFRAAVLKLKFGAFAWECPKCRRIVQAPKDEPQLCDNDGCRHAKMNFGYRGLTIHGMRRSCVVYYRERKMPDALIMAITGHTTLEVFKGYSVSDLQAQRRAMKEATRPQLVAAD